MDREKNLAYIKNSMRIQKENLMEKDILEAKGIRDTMEKVRRFHKNFSCYEPTPLVSPNGLARALGLGKLWVKDESRRFGLNAFKVLGGLYAMSRALEENEVAAGCAPLLFVTATDGNHGRGVAWAAKTLGHRAVVFLPRRTAPSRMDNIEKEGALVEMLPMGYDDAVRHAADYARANGGNLIQDTAWKGYGRIPGWIMEGYYTIMDEISDQLAQKDGSWPTHVFLQAGVGSFAGAMTSCLKALSMERGYPMPRVVVMEPHDAACIYASVQAASGESVAAEGELQTMMAGLACGELNPVSWEILKEMTWGCLSCHDGLSALGMRILGNPLKGDPAVVSGESGGIGVGVLYALAKDEALAPVREEIGLEEESRVLLISTEGDTDPENYRRVVWEGKGGSYR